MIWHRASRLPATASRSEDLAARGAVPARITRRADETAARPDNRPRARSVGGARACARRCAGASARHRARRRSHAAERRAWRRERLEHPRPRLADLVGAGTERDDAPAEGGLPAAGVPPRHPDRPVLTPRQPRRLRALPHRPGALDRAADRRSATDHPAHRARPRGPHRAPPAGHDGVRRGIDLDHLAPARARLQRRQLQRGLPARGRPLGPARQRSARIADDASHLRDAAPGGRRQARRRSRAPDRRRAHAQGRRQLGADQVRPHGHRLGRATARRQSPGRPEPRPVPPGAPRPRTHPREPGEIGPEQPRRPAAVPGCARGPGEPPAPLGAVRRRRRAVPRGRRARRGPRLPAERRHPHACRRDRQDAERRAVRLVRGPRT